MGPVGAYMGPVGGYMGPVGAYMGPVGAYMGPVGAYNVKSPVALLSYDKFPETTIETARLFD